MENVSESRQTQLMFQKVDKHIFYDSQKVYIESRKVYTEEQKDPQPILHLCFGFLDQKMFWRVNKHNQNDKNG